MNTWFARMNTWKSIDSAPKDGTTVLLAVNSAVFDGWWCDKRGAWIDEEIILGVGRGYSPSHWMPLPEPPQ